MPDPISPEQRDRLVYAFGHLVSSFSADAHAGDSGWLAREVLTEEGLSERELALIEVFAEHVYANYHFTGEGLELLERIHQGAI